MADNRIQIKIELEKGGATASLKNFQGDLIKSGVAVGDLRKELGNFVISSQRMSNSVKLTQKELRSLEKTVGGFRTATGGATSAAMELGRVVSDAPYGIRGMANNVSQLASQITYMASATDITTGKTVGFVGAIKGVGRALMGTTGVLLAIQAVIAAVDYFANRTDNATDSASDFESGIDDLVSTLDELSISQSKVNDKILEYIQYRAFSLKSDEELKGVLEDLSDIEDDIASKRKKNANFELLFKEKSKGLTIEQYKALSEQEKAEVRRTAGIVNLTQRIDDYERSIESVSKLEDERVEAIKRAVGIRQSQIDSEEEFKAAEEGTLKALKDKLKELKKDREVLSKTAADYKRLSVEIEKTQKAIEAIEGSKKTKGRSKKFSPFKDPKELEFDIKNQEKALLSLEKQIEAYTLKKQMNDELASAKTEYEKKKIREKYRRLQLESELEFQRKQIELNRDLEISKAKEKEKSYQDDLKRENELFKTKVENEFKLGNITKEQRDKLIDDADKKTEKRSKEAETRLKTTIASINESYKVVLSTFDKLAKLKLDSLFVSEDGEPLKLKDYLEKAKVLLSGFSEFISANIDRRIAEETNQTNRLNEELNNRLLNENLSKDERARIQNEIWQNDEKLRKRTNELKKKQFNTQKAFNIAQATIDTYFAAQRAYASQMTLTPDAPIRAKIAAAVATAAGLARVAAIASQKFQPEAASTPIRTASGGGGGGVGDRSFNFNLVGANQQNQLVNAIQSQFEKPLKAYVVSKDITNQMALDANIKSTARFGG